MKPNDFSMEFLFDKELTYEAKGILMTMLVTMNEPEEIFSAEAVDKYLHEQGVYTQATIDALYLLNDKGYLKFGMPIGTIVPHIFTFYDNNGKQRK